jgi:cystathionine beta-synthase
LTTYSYDFVPEVLSREPGIVDYWVKSSDDDAFKWTQILIREEGLLVGGSSGSIMSGAVSWLKSPVGWQECGGQKGKNAVIMLPDG